MFIVENNKITITANNTIIIIHVISKSANVDIDILNTSTNAILHTDTIYVENNNVIGKLTDYLQ